MREVNVGIDLGTTYSAVAYYNQSTGQTEIFNNSYEKICTPSVVCIQNGKVLIGEDAKIEQKAGNIDTAAFYKSMMGDPNYSAYIEGKEYTAEDLSALFLRGLIKDIEETNDIKIKSAIITVPAYFNEKQREATIRAGKAAGINVMKIINEPTSAIIAYGLTKGKDKNVLVYDLGGGTFDVTIAKVNASNGKVDVIVTNGDHQLGGKDWDDVIFEMMKEEFYREYSIDVSTSTEDSKELQVACEEAKQRLTNLSSTFVSVHCAGAQGKYTLTREDFEYNTEGLLDKTMMFVNSCFEEVKSSTGKPFGWANIDEVVLVGGSTRMPQVKERITKEFGKPPVTRDINVDTIVATGAAIEAQLYKCGSLQIGGVTLSLSSIQDITSHSLGMLAMDAGDNYVNSIILRKNSKINTVFSKEYVAAGDKLDVYVLQGESRDPYNNDILGKYVVSGIPGRGEHVIVNFLYNSSGVVEVTANTKSNAKLTVTKEEVNESMDSIIARLKEEAKKVVAQDIEVMLLIDTSGSMSGDSMVEAKKAAHEFVRSFDLSYTHLSIASFSDKTKFHCVYANKLSDIKRAIDNIEVADTGYCNEENPIGTNWGKFKNKKDPRVIVILTDGYWDDQPQEERNADRAKADGVIIYGIGIGGADEAFLRRISSGKGKKVDLSELTKTFKEVASSIAKEVGGTSIN